MTTKAYLVTWLGKGKIDWKPLTENELLTSNLSQAINLTQSLTALTCGLQLVNITISIRTLMVVNEIQRDVKEIKGKFEILFLEKSIDYFLEAHKNSHGLIPSVIYALEKDVYNSLQCLNDSKNLEVPSYLEHKIYVLATSIKLWNEVLYATIHNGAIPKVSSDHIKTWIERTKNIANRTPDGGYVDNLAVLNEWEKFIQNYSEENSWFGKDQTLMEKALSKDFFYKNKSLIFLARELQYSAELNHSLEDFLLNQNNPSLFLKVS